MIALAIVAAAFLYLLLGLWGLDTSWQLRALERRLEELERERRAARRLIEAWPPTLEAFRPQDQRR